MSKVCILGDTHFAVRNGSKVFSEYFESFYSNVFFPYLLENNITHIIQLGDLFDHRKYTNLQGLSGAREYFFDKLKEYNIRMTVLVGNHDIYHKNTLQINSPSLLLQEYDNIDIIKNPTTISINDTDVDIIPWICSENEEESTKLIRESKSSICFGHFEIVGFGMIRGIVSHEGIDATSFSKYEYVFTGHYHHRSNRGNIYYTGTPYELTWNDHGDTKGFYIFDLHSRELDFITNPYRLFNKVFYDDVLNEEVLKQQVIDNSFSHLHNTYVKVVVKNKENSFLFDSYLDSLYKVSPVDLVVIEENQDVLNEEIEDIDETEDTITILNKFVDSLKQKELDPNKVKNILSNLYNEAISLES